MTTQARPTVAAPSTYDADRVSAWGRYLADTTTAPAASYHEVEPWAWLRLQNELKGIRDRERGLHS